MPQVGQGTHIHEHTSQQLQSPRRNAPGATQKKKSARRIGGAHNRLHTTNGMAAANEGPRSRERHHGAGTHAKACMPCHTSQVQPTRAAADAPPLQLHTAGSAACAVVKGPRVVQRVRGVGARRRCCLSARHVRQQSKGCVPKGAWHAGKPPLHAANRQSCLRLVCSRVPYPPSAHKNMQGRISSTVSRPGTTGSNTHTPDRAASKGQAQPACDNDRGYTQGRYATDRGWPGERRHC